MKSSLSPITRPVTCSLHVYMYFYISSIKFSSQCLFYTVMNSACAGISCRVPIFTLCVQTAIVVSSRSTCKLFPQTSFPVCMFESSLLLDSPSSIPRVLKLKCLDIGDVTIEFRGSSRDCQHTFEWYCTLHCYMYFLRLKRFC